MKDKITKKHFEATLMKRPFAVGHQELWDFRLAVVIVLDKKTLKAT